MKKDQLDLQLGFSKSVSSIPDFGEIPWKRKLNIQGIVEDNRMDTENQLPGRKMQEYAFWWQKSTECWQDLQTIVTQVVQSKVSCPC